MEMREFKMFALAMLMVAVAAMVSASAAPASPQDEQAVRQANEAFYKALNTMFQGDIKPMQAVWSQADDVTYMGPDGKFLVGWKDVFADWQTQAAKKLGGSIRPEKINTKIGQDLATVECYEVGENIVGGKPTKVSIRATNVYRKENGQWKMIGHHTDTLPFLVQ
jgi:ketosteroid isomerase-like protein